MEKVIEFSTKKVLEYNELLTLKEGVVCAYKNTVYINTKEEYSHEGICYLKDLLELKDNKGLPGIDLVMYKKEVQNVFINNNPNNIHFYENIDPLKINNPYSYTKNNNDWGLYYIKCSNNSIYDHNNEELPHGIYFDYTSGHISNDMFNLEDMLKRLKQRKDIKFNNGENKILPIPLYNCYMGKNRYLKFLWTPSKEDYELIKNLNYHSRYEYIIENIFGINRKVNVYES